MTSSALTFEIIQKCNITKARRSILHLPHGPVQTPTFMPVGTQASLKGLTSKQLSDLGCRLQLCNTYHLGLKPGQKILDSIGGAHALESWPHNLLTDSGGFQMVSLLKLAKITEEGVQFASPHDGSLMLLTPEHSMALQNSIGADIIMQLDDVVSSLTTGPRVEEAMLRSIRWLDRCIQAHVNTDTQNLFCIIQGGLDLALRRKCCEEMAKRNTPGIAIGGLSGGEEKPTFTKIVSACTDVLPDTKVRYLMGVGYAEDLVICVALGIDLFDCVFPTRTARFGNAITPSGMLNLRTKQYAEDFRPIDSTCPCPCCRPHGWNITRAFIHSLVGRETAGAHYLTIHNVCYQLELMRQMREAITNGTFSAFVKSFFDTLYHGMPETYPKWAVDALETVGIELRP